MLLRRHYAQLQLPRLTPKQNFYPLTGDVCRPVYSKDWLFERNQISFVGVNGPYIYRSVLIQHVSLRTAKRERRSDTGMERARRSSDILVAGMFVYIYLCNEN